jgi:hypothetical protein
MTRLTGERVINSTFVLGDNRRVLHIALFAGWALLNALPVALTVHANWFGEYPLPDWYNYELNAQRLLAGESIYQREAWPFLYSPVMAALMVPVVALGYPLFALAHFAVLALVRKWWLVVAVSWPFWTDVAAGNVFTFVVVLAVCALRGERWAQYGYLAACLLMPRPVQLPVLLYLLWHEPRLRWPFAAMTIVHGILVLPWLAEWWGVLTWIGGHESGMPWNYGPSRLVGTAWLVVGVPLAGFLLWKHKPGLAGLALSPYWLPYYLLMGLLGAEQSRAESQRSRSARESPVGS